jgi:hypothetical protein
MKPYERYALEKYLIDLEAARLEALAAQEPGVDKIGWVQVRLDEYLPGIHLMSEAELLALDRFGFHPYLASACARGGDADEPDEEFKRALDNLNEA